MRHLFAAIVLSAVPALTAADGFDLKVLEKPSTDARLGPWKTLDSGYPFVPPKTLPEWEARSAKLRRQLLVALGMWPMPEKSPLDAKVFGAIDRKTYTVEKVYFRSTPGHYVTGNLYRPKQGDVDVKLPAVLFAHGHWKDGRLHEATEAKQNQDVKSGGEPDALTAKYPTQVPAAALAQQGFVVFVFDMVGVADSSVLPHGAGFGDVKSELHLHSAMGLQAWNCLRAFDFLSELDGVDPKRIGVTGASGGGTQTFILGAIDPRPAALFPAVMVSEKMQGGCVCENCSHLRVLGGNVEIAALAAPRPLGMTGADDWSREIETQGLPQLKALYKLYGKEDFVAAKSWPEFPHNFNRPAREMMESFFRKHLQGKADAVKEPAFEPIPPKELRVFDEQHPRPKDELDAAALKKLWSERDAATLKKLADEPAKFREVVGGGWDVIAGDLPEPSEVEAKEVGEPQERDGVKVRKYLVSRVGENNQIPVVGVRGAEFDGTVLLWAHPNGKAGLFRDGVPSPELADALKRKMAVMAIDPFGVGEKALPKPKPVDAKFAGYTFGYNRAVPADQVRDILAAIAMAKAYPKTKRVLVFGQGEPGTAALLAVARSRGAVEAAYCEVGDFAFGAIASADNRLIPGALKYGGVGGAAALFAPNRLRLGVADRNAEGIAFVEKLYAADPKRLSIDDHSISAASALAWLAGDPKPNPPKE